MVQRAQAAAQKSMAAYRSADAAFKQAAAVKGAAMRPAETIQASIQIAKSKVRLEQTRSQAKFACIVLGRECIKHGYVPKPVTGQAREVEALRNQYVVREQLSKPSNADKQNS